MLRPRIIPCLLIHEHGLVKTTNFKDPRYLGDPINAVRIFNEKEVDELMILDIDATKENREPDYKTIEYWATECRMPLCYGGGIKTRDQAQKVFELGVEKIAISSGAIKYPKLVSEISEQVGTQSVVVVIDVKKNVRTRKYEIWINNAQKNTTINPVEFSYNMEQLGAGEVVINSIDNDGIMKGYDFDLIQEIRDKISLPITVVGGCGSLLDIKQLISKFGIIGACAGSLFVYKGKYKAVLINYPSRDEKETLIRESYIEKH